jgi:arsenate reductase
MKILILCTGNSCRSQMARAFLQSLSSRIQVESAGTEPAARVHPRAVEVMAEIGLDIQSAYPKSVREFLDQTFDYVITVCGGAKESCPVFTGQVGQRLHIGFDDPAEASGTDAEVILEFRRVRDGIRKEFQDFFDKEIRPRLNGGF